MQSVLKRLDDSVRRVTERLHAQMCYVSSSRGLAKLPDELLIRVFAIVQNLDMSGQPRRSYDRLRRITAVCRRFRALVCSTASFWTDVGDFLCADELDVYLSRSKNARLNVSLECHEGGWRDGLRFLEKVVPHCRRWKSFDIDFNGYAFVRPSKRYIERAYDLMHGLHTDALESIQWELPDADNAVGEGCIEDDADVYHVYTTWVAPRLGSLSGFKIVPRESSRVHGATFSLTSCDLFFCGRWQIPRNLLSRFYAFLSSQPRLESLDIHYTNFPMEIRNVNQTSKPVTLPSLRRLCLMTDIDSHLRDDDLFDVQKFLCRLALPIIEHIQIFVPIHGNHFRLESILPPFNDYSKLETLDLTFHGVTEYAMQLSPLQPIFMRCPNLTSLLIYAEGIQLTVEVPSPDGCPPPPLRKLEISQCEPVTTESLLELVDYLRRHPGEFEEFRVLDCPSNMIQIFR